jgi:hypothetical protein
VRERLPTLEQAVVEGTLPVVSAVQQLIAALGEVQAGKTA